MFAFCVCDVVSFRCVYVFLFICMFLCMFLFSGVVRLCVVFAFIRLLCLWCCVVCCGLFVVVSCFGLRCCRV